MIPYLVGIDEHNSAMDIATHWMKTIAMIHPHTIPAVPAKPIPKKILTFRYKVLAILPAQSVDTYHTKACLQKKAGGRAQRN